MYADLFKRNQGYISDKVQKKLRNSSILIAGCGIGSTVAETLIRMGCENITLVDNDEVSIHNLNRQTFQHRHIGQKKAEALREHLLSINPKANIVANCKYINQENASEIIGDHSFIFDTIDFLDLSGLIALHDSARLKGIPVLSSLAIGWGCGSLFFNEQSLSFRELFSLPEKGLPTGSYREVFASFLGNISCFLDETVLSVVSQALVIMEDGKPCPASQVSPGASAVGAFSGYLYFKYLSNEFIPGAPQMIYLDFNDLVKNSLLNTLGA